MYKFSILLLILSNLLIAQQSIDVVLDGYKKDKELQHASYSFCVIEASTGKLIKEYNSELALIPASTLKIITTSAALGILGKDYTYKTHFYTSTLTDTATNKSTANLIIKSSGDPSFNSQYFNDNDSVFLNGLITKLKAAKNFKPFTGNVIIDNSAFDNTIPSTWIWGDIGNYFGAGATSLSYKDNKVSLFYTSDAPNSSAKLVDIKPIYFLKKLQLQSQVKAFGSDDNAVVFGDPNTFVRFVSGTIPPNKKNYEVEAQMPEPAQFFAEELTTQLQKQKLISNSKPIVSSQKNNAALNELLFTYQSPKLEKIVYYTNVKSDNHYAESLLNTLGATTSGKQGTTDNGITAVENFWKERGIDVSGLHMVDGSGLSRANTITTKIQANVLSKIYRDSLLYPSFNASLPIAGKNGSMINLCKGTFAENNLRAKTGYINRARGYCGYVKTKSGKELAFSVLFNNYTSTPKEMKLKIEKLLLALVEL